MLHLFTVCSQWHKCMPDSFHFSSFPSEKAPWCSQLPLIPCITLLCISPTPPASWKWVQVWYPCAPVAPWFGWRFSHRARRATMLCTANSMVESSFQGAAGGASGRHFLQVETLLGLTVSAGPGHRWKAPPRSWCKDLWGQRSRYLSGQQLSQGPIFHSRVSTAWGGKQSSQLKCSGKVVFDFLLLKLLLQEPSINYKNSGESRKFAVIAFKIRIHLSGNTYVLLIREMISKPQGLLSNWVFLCFIFGANPVFVFF